MKWSLLILASLQLLIANAQYNSYDPLLEDIFVEKVRPCGLNKYCVPRHLCNEIDNDVDTSGRAIIDIRINSLKVCEYLDKCCDKNKIDQTDHTVNLPESNPNHSNELLPQLIPTHTPNEGCGYRNKDGLKFKTTHATHKEAQFAEFPWMVAILGKNSNNKLENKFGGSLITPFIVLTAAHCVNNEVANKLIARAGDWDMLTRSEPLPHQDQTVSKIIIHESFDDITLFYDVALLKLDGPLMIEQNVQPICLPPPYQEIDESRCFVTGWGKNKFGNDGRYQQILKKIDVPMVDHNVCQKQLRKTRLSEFFELHDSFICAGGELEQDACTGDGGSPLVCRLPGSNDRYFQAGIVAWGIGCGEQDVPGVYTNIVNVLPWLTENLNKLKANPKHFTATTTQTFFDKRMKILN